MADPHYEVSISVEGDDFLALIDAVTDCCDTKAAIDSDVLWCCTVAEQRAKQSLVLAQGVLAGILIGMAIGHTVTTYTALGILLACVALDFALSRFDRKTPGSAAAFALQEGLRAIHPPEPDDV